MRVVAARVAATNIAAMRDAAAAAAAVVVLSRQDSWGMFLNQRHRFGTKNQRPS